MIGLPLVWLVIGGRPSPVQVTAELRRAGEDLLGRAGTREATVWTRQAVLRVPRLWTLMVPFALALRPRWGSSFTRSVCSLVALEGVAAVSVLGRRGVRADP